MFGEPGGPQSTTPDPPSVQPKLMVAGMFRDGGVTESIGGVITGGVRSTLMVSIGIDVAACPLVVVRMVSAVPELSCAWYVTVVFPATVPATFTDPVAPVMLPTIGVGAFAPLIM